jgi:hypothetical protein
MRFGYERQKIKTKALVTWVATKGNRGATRRAHKLQ